ncbi:hypothetical protein L9F63_003173, partial [Diploptera punctata]
MNTCISSYTHCIEPQNDLSTSRNVDIKLHLLHTFSYFRCLLCHIFQSLFHFFGLLAYLLLTKDELLSVFSIFIILVILIPVLVLRLLSLNWIAFERSMVYSA